MSDRPDWLRLGEDILGPFLRDTLLSLRQFSGPDFHITQMPTLALYHLAHSLQTTIDTNREGRHAVALSLLRQAVEALTLIELGLLDPGFSYHLVQEWDSGKKTQGELRGARRARVAPIRCGAVG